MNLPATRVQAEIEDTGHSRLSQALGDVPALAAIQLAGVFLFSLDARPRDPPLPGR